MNLLNITRAAMVAVFAALVGLLIGATVGAPFIGAAVGLAVNLSAYLVPPVPGLAYTSVFLPGGGRRNVMQGRPAMVSARDEKRAAYNSIMQEYKGNERVVLTEGYLRLEQLFTATRLFTFPVLSNEGTQRTAEQRLAPADAFHVDRICFYIGARSTAAGVPQSAVAMETFGNTANLGANLNAFWTLYAGKLSVKVDSVDMVKQLDLIGFRFVGSTQTGRVPATGGLDLASEWNSSEVWRDIVPTFRLNGGSANEVTISLPDTPAAITPPANTELVIGFVFKGWLAQNGAAYNPRGGD